MLSRRQFIATATAAAALNSASLWGKPARMLHKERVDRALRGQDVDRPPFSLWQHFHQPTAEAEANSLVEFHRLYGTDIVKVMNDFSYPKSSTDNWYELAPVDSPYPNQLQTLKLVRDRLQGNAYFIDTLFSPPMTAMLLFAATPQFANKKLNEDLLLNEIGAPLRAFQQQNAQAWHDMMEVITASTVNHINQARNIGVSGALVSVMNAITRLNSVEDYNKYSRPYDKRIFEALADTPLTMLHLHFLDQPFVAQFGDFNAPVVNYSVKASGISMSEMRKVYPQTLAGGVDEVNFDSLTVGEMRQQWMAAREQAGKKYIITPGCSVPDTTGAAALARLRESVVA